MSHYLKPKSNTLFTRTNPEHQPSSGLISHYPCDIRKIRECIHKVVEVLIPDRCCLCHSVSKEGYCNNCRLFFPWIRNGCQQCGTSLASGFLCGQCQKRDSYWNEAIIPFLYTDPISSQIHELKYQGKFSAAAALARMLASTVIKRSSALPDMIIPVPLHSRSLKKRGYNQSTLIARSLGKILGIPINEEVVVKSRYTESQTRLDQGARRANIEGAFDVVKYSHGGSIAVVDDVITSGATIREVCKTLRRSGYDQLSIWAVAKTPIDR